MKQEIQKTIDRVVGTEGILRIPAWWMHKILSDLVQYCEGLDSSDNTIKDYIEGQLNLVGDAVKALDARLTVVEAHDLFAIVSELPAMPKDNTIYLVASADREAGNALTEWVYINGAWEQFGEFKADVDLSGYVTTSAFNSTMVDLGTQMENLDSAIKELTNQHSLDIQITAQRLSYKVDKEEGKGLSSNDYTTEEKEKLASLENYDDTAIKNEVTALKEKDAQTDAKFTELSVSVGQNTASISSLAANKADKDWVTEQIVDSLLSQVYGVAWYTGTVTSPAFTEGQTKLIRIGNLNLHHSLPVQSKMRGCLLDDEGNVVKYLNPNNWKQDDLSGASGQVMVEIPDFFIRYTDTEVSEGISRRAVEISLLPFDGSKPVKKCYIGAYEASLDGDGKLSSMAGVLPKTVFPMPAFRTAARKRNTSNTKWNILPYEQYKVIFWLYTIEYANRYSQMAVDNSLDDNGYHQGGLGIGVTNISNWPDYNGYYPFVVAGSSDSLGNESGEVTIPTSEYVNNGVTLATGDNLVHVNRYRGIELPFGHIFKYIDGVRVYAPDSVEERAVYTTDDANKFIAGDASIEGWTPIGNEVGANGYIKELLFGSNGEIMCAENGGGSTTYWTDSHYIANTGLRAVVFGGYALHGATAGLAFSSSSSAPSSTLAFVGSRLCFLP